MSDHSVISLELNLNKIERGKGYFKVNNSLVLQPEYQDKIRNANKETVDIIKTQTPIHFGKLLRVVFEMKQLNTHRLRKKNKIKKKTNFRKKLIKLKPI